MGELKNKKVLVSGGAGFIGSHLVDRLVEMGCYVNVIDNLSNGSMENLHHHEGRPNFVFFESDVTDPFDVADVMKDVEIVFHLACLGVRHSIRHPFETHRVNAEGTLFMLQEAWKNKVEKFIYCSSSEVYGTAEHVPMLENHPLAPCTVYGASKLAGEMYTSAYNKTYGLNTIIIRPFNTYGPRSHYEGNAGELIPKTIVRALGGQPVLIFGDGSQTRDFTYVEDTVEAIVKIAASNEALGQIVNIGSNFEITIRDTVERIIEIIGRGDSEKNIRYLPGRPGDVWRLYADVSKLHRITDWHSNFSFEDGLIETIEWFKSRFQNVPELLSGETGVNW